MTDAVSDMLTRIRNANMVGKDTVELHHTNLLWSIAKLLEDEGYLAGVEKHGRKVGKSMEVVIAKEPSGKSRIHGLQRVSRPGKRIYKKSAELQPVKNNLGIAVISTSKGVTTNQKAKAEGVGGEILFTIW